MEFLIRDSNPDDLERIVEIYNSTVPSRMVTADTEFVSVESRRRWFDEHNAQTRPLWVLLDKFSNSIIGWVSFQSFYGRPAYNFTTEISIYLDESVRGQGIGKEILQYSIERARLIGIKTVLGFIFDHNEPSLKLFRWAGFEEWAFLPRIAVLDGVERGVKIMGKRISQ
jgi:L-amino acid N-acyltransferase YncA